jgi:hypothetical protein
LLDNLTRARDTGLTENSLSVAVNDEQGRYASHPKPSGCLSAHATQHIQPNNLGFAG